MKASIKTEDEQQIWQECSRLLTNCVIYYNTLILSNFQNHQRQFGDEGNLPDLKKVSPVAWQHINLHGRYEFTKPPDPIDMNEMIKVLMRRSNKNIQAA